jgi:hypothetical protein
MLVLQQMVWQMHDGAEDLDSCSATQGHRPMAHLAGGLGQLVDGLLGLHYSRLHLISQ